MMKKKIFALCTALFLLATGAFAQTGVPTTPLDPSNPNYEHDRFMALWMSSKDEPVSEVNLQILHQRALKMQMQDERMLRNQFIFRILENKKLSVTDRIWAADFFYRQAQIDLSYPVEYIQMMKTVLLSQKN